MGQPSTTQTSEQPTAKYTDETLRFLGIFHREPACTKVREFTKVLMNGLWRPGSTLLFDEPQAVKTENVIHRFKGLLAPLSSSSSSSSYTTRSSCDNEVFKMFIGKDPAESHIFFLKPIRDFLFQKKKKNLSLIFTTKAILPIEFGQKREFLLCSNF